MWLAGCGDSSAPGPDTAAADAAPDVGAADKGAPDAAPQPDAKADQGSALTYDSFAKQFVQKYCSPCHFAGGNARDLSTYAAVVSNAPDIRCGVSPTKLSGCSGTPAPSQFPIGNGPKPAASERDQLVQWIDDGTPKQ